MPAWSGGAGGIRAALQDGPHGTGHAGTRCWRWHATTPAEATAASTSSPGWIQAGTVDGVADPKNEGIDPAPTRSGQGWRALLAARAKTILDAGFFHVDTAGRMEFFVAQGRFWLPSQPQRMVHGSLTFGEDGVLDVYAVVRTLGAAPGCLSCNGLIDPVRLADASTARCMHAAPYGSPHQGSKRFGEPLLPPRIRPLYVRNQRGAATSPDQR